MTMTGFGQRISEAGMRRRDLLALLGGAAAARPFAARAQQRAMPVLGFLGATSAGPHAQDVAALREGLSGMGYSEGKNLAIEFRWAEGHYDQLPALAGDLVGRPVDLIVSAGGFPAALAAKTATPTIPIVFETGGDPVDSGLVAGLARPGGNLTGVSILVVELHAKRLELLAELVPQARAIALLLNSAGTANARITRDVQQAALAKGIQLHVLTAGGDELEPAFAALVKLGAGALIVSSDPFFSSRREQLVELASRHSVPTIYQWREFAVAGGLISYGTSLPAVYHLLGTYAGKILNGAKPADLPVQQPTKFELAINLKTAKALGLTVPQSLLLRADEVIE